MKAFIQRAFRNDVIVLGIAFILALFIRTWDLSNVPYGFHRDEVANTYIGRFILLNGQDIYGNRWPILYVDKFGDYPPVIPMYLSGAATFAFGLNAFSARFPSAFLGSLIVIPLFWFLAVFLNRKIAVAGSFLMAVFPWHVVLSRSSAEGIIGLTVCMSGMALIAYGVKVKKRIILVAATVVFLLTYLLYPSFRLLVPLILLPLPLVFAKGKEKANRSVLVIVCLAIGASVLISTTQWGKGRFFQTSLFSNPTEAANLQNDTVQQIFNDGGLPVLLTRVFHNRVVAYVQRFTELYIGYFSPVMLFLTGGLPPRYQVPHLGLIPITLGISMLVCLLIPVTLIERRRRFFLIYLLFISPLPAVITVDDWPNVHRGIFMIIPVVALGAASIVNTVSLLSQKGLLRRILTVCAAGIVVLEGIFTSHQYFAHAGNHNSHTRNDGHVQLVQYLIDHRDKYDRIYVSQKDWLALYYLFYTNSFDSSIAGTIQSDFIFSGLGSIEFEPSECPSHKRLKFFTQEVKERIAVIDLGFCTVPAEYSQADVILRKDGTHAYRVLHPVRKL